MTASAPSFASIAHWVDHVKTHRSLNEAIEVVNRWIRVAARDEYDCWASHLDLLLWEARRYDEALSVVDQMIERSPGTIYLWIKKASYYRYLGKPEQALTCIDRALHYARLKGHHHREVLGRKARILLSLNRGEELPPLLEEIMSLRMVRGTFDVARERDFVDWAPPGAIPADLRARYDAFCPPSSDQNGLRSRRLYELATDYCD